MPSGSEWQMKPFESQIIIKSAHTAHFSEEGCTMLIPAYYNIYHYLEDSFKLQNITNEVILIKS